MIQSKNLKAIVDIEHKKQRAEVVAMSILEYNEEEEIKKIRASERRGGYDDGWNAGRIEGEAA